MCGIVGVSGDFLEENLSLATEALSHRGPDDHGLYISESAHIGLGHTRLAIIELSPLGHQPMLSTDGEVALIFNGEIYNFKSLREDLKGKGYIFKGNSDTEVVLNMYIEFGMDCLPLLDGIFTLAIHDTRSNELLIARDSLGVKPLYYFLNDHLFAFASEIKALIHLIPERLDINLESLERYMTFLWCPGQGTLASSIHKVLPGEYLTVKAGKIVNHTHWFKLPQTQYKSTNCSSKNLIADLQEKLSDAVQRQMISDVPVGSFLSGGLDSSAIVHFAQAHAKNLQCFTIEPQGGSDQSFAEDLPYALRVAKHLDVDLEVVKINPHGLAADLEEMIWQLDEPLADPAPLNVLYISRLAKQQGIKVLLSGSGGDDLFTGYRRHLALRYQKVWSWLPISARQKLESLSLNLDQSSTIGRRMSRLFTSAGTSGDERLVSYFAWARRNDLFPLFSRSVQQKIETINPAKPMMDFLETIDHKVSSIDRMLALEQRFFLPDHNLTYTDKMSMAAGVEVRVPFLDQALVEFASTIPDKYKQRGATGKWILKKAMEPFLPHDVIYRPKTGFGAPLRRWIKEDLRDMVSDVLSEQNIKNRGLFDYMQIKQLLDDNDSGKKDAAYTLFSLLCIEIWSQKFIDSDTKSI